MPCHRVALTWLSAAVLASGCASPGKPVTQTVQIETPGCAQVSCELSNDLGRWTLPRTPGSVTLTTSTAPLQVSCRADGGVLGDAGRSASAAPVTGAGAVTGGVVGGVAIGTALGATALTFIPVLGALAVLTGAAAGAAVGQAAEAQQRALRYPATISVSMNCAPGPALAQLPAPRFGLGIRGASPDEARAAGLGERRAVWVTVVAPGSLAAAAGMQAGDLVVEADGAPLADAADLEERVLALAPGTSISLRLRRGDQDLVRVLARPPAVP